MKKVTDTKLSVDGEAVLHVIKGLETAMNECMREMHLLTSSYSYGWSSKFTKKQRDEMIKVVKLGEQLANLERAISSLEDEFELASTTGV